MRGIDPRSRGLENHEVAQVINTVRDAVEKKDSSSGSLRGVIACAVLRTLRGLDLPMDEPYLPKQG